MSKLNNHPVNPAKIAGGRVERLPKKLIAATSDYTSMLVTATTHYHFPTTTPTLEGTFSYVSLDGLLNRLIKAKDDAKQNAVCFYEGFLSDTGNLNIASSIQ